mgnify:CR=1 FL=1
MLTINLPHNNISTILFDLDGTLCHHSPSSLDVILQILLEKGLERFQNPQTWRKTRHWSQYYWAQSPEVLEDIAVYGDLTETFWDHYLWKKLIVIGCTEEEANQLLPEIQSLMEERYHPESFIPEDIMPTLNALREKDFTLGLVSNRSEPFHDEIEKLGLAGFFDFAFTAGEVGVWKPDKEIFQHALTQAQSIPKEAIYIGDNYYADIVGAQQAGLEAILVDPQRVFPKATCRVIDSVSELVKT